MKNGVFQAIDDPSATNGTAAFGINDLEQVVGDYFTAEFVAPIHGFLLDAGVFTTIDVPFPGSLNTVVRGIDSRGDLAGLFFDAQGNHGFIASPRATIPEPSSGTLLGFAIAALVGLLGGSKLVDVPKTQAHKLQHICARKNGRGNAERPERRSYPGTLPRSTQQTLIVFAAMRRRPFDLIDNTNNEAGPLDAPFLRNGPQFFHLAATEARTRGTLVRSGAAAGVFDVCRIISLTLEAAAPTPPA